MNIISAIVLSGSWAYENELIDLLFIDGKNSVDLTEYVPSNEWKIMETHAFKHKRLINGKNYSDLSFNLILRRNSNNLIYILIVPCLLLELLTSVRNL